MDDNQHTPVSDDQELANVLAGMNQNATGPAEDTGLTVIDPPAEGSAPISTPELQFEETPLTPVGDADSSEAPSTDSILPPVEPLPSDAPVEEFATAEAAPAAEPALDVTPAVTPVPADTSSPELDNIKKDALEELRPLVGKLDLPADEKFDTLLLIIRSTDDKTLVNAAFDAAKGILDENKRAQALLDVIKEIDYFSGHGENPAA